MTPLKPTALIVYHKLHGTGETFIGSFNEISKQTGLSRRGCIYAVRTLEKAGLVVTVKVATGRGVYTNGYITFPLNEPLSYSSPSASQIEKLRAGLCKLSSCSQEPLVVPPDVRSLVKDFGCTGARFAPGVEGCNGAESKLFKLRCRYEGGDVNVCSHPSAKSPDKGKYETQESNTRRGKGVIWVRFVDRQSLAEPGETVIDLQKIFGVQKYIAVRNASTERIKRAIEAVVAYGRKYVIRNLEAILVAAVVRGWKVARRVVDWARMQLAPQVNTRDDDKYRDLYRLVSDEEAERNRASCSAAEAEPEDKYRDLYRLVPAGC